MTLILGLVHAFEDDHFGGQGEYWYCVLELTVVANKRLWPSTTISCRPLSAQTRNHNYPRIKITHCPTYIIIVLWTITSLRYQNPTADDYEGCGQSKSAARGKLEINVIPCACVTKCA